MTLDCYIFYIIGLITGWFSIFIGTPIGKVPAIWQKIVWLIILIAGTTAIWYLTDQMYKQL